MADSIDRFMNRSVLVLGQETPCRVVARALHERHVGSAVISDRHGQIVGFVTDRDLATQILGFDVPATTPVSEIMTVGALSVGRFASVGDVAHIMLENGVRRIPVIEKIQARREKCIGMVTLDDLIASGAVRPEVIARIVKSQIRRRFQSIHSSRHEGHRVQTFNVFKKVMSRKMNLPRSVSEQVTLYLLRQVVQRLPYTEAANFISQLPGLVQDDLLSLPAGPDSNINEESIIGGLLTNFQLSKNAALEVVKRFWEGLEQTVDRGILHCVLDRFPREMRDIFSHHGTIVAS